MSCLLLWVSLLLISLLLISLLLVSLLLVCLLLITLLLSWFWLLNYSRIICSEKFGQILLKLLIILIISLLLLWISLRCILILIICLWLILSRWIRTILSWPINLSRIICSKKFNQISLKLRIWWHSIIWSILISLLNRIRIISCKKFH